MRVLHIALHFAEYSLSGIRALALKEPASSFLLVLVRSNFDAEIDAKKLRDLPRNLEIRLLNHDRKISTALSNAFSLVVLARGFHPDVIHCQEEPKDCLIFALPFLRAQVKVLTVHDPRPHTGDSGRKSKISRLAFYVRILRRWAKSYVVHGAALAKDLCEDFGGEKPIVSVPIGPYGVLSEVEFTSVPASGRLLFFGRMEAYKGVSIFIDAVKKIRAEGIPVIGVLAGRGPALDVLLDEVIADSGFELINRFLSQEDVIRQFDACQLVVLPYLNATQSGVVAYALGRGRGVIATDVGALPEVVRDGFNGLLVKPGDLTGLVETLKLALGNFTVCENMGRNSLSLGRGDFSWRRNAELTFSFYKDLLALNGVGRVGK